MFDKYKKIITRIVIFAMIFGILPQNVVGASSGGTYIISTIAGNGTSGYSGDGGPAINATFGDLTEIEADSTGNIYIYQILVIAVYER